MSVLLPVTPSCVGRVEIVCPQQPQHTYDRKRTCNSADNGQHLRVFSTDARHLVTLLDHAWPGQANWDGGETVVTSPLHSQPRLLLQTPNASNNGLKMRS